MRVDTNPVFGGFIEGVADANMFLEKLDEAMQLCRHQERVDRVAEHQ